MFGANYAADFGKPVQAVDTSKNARLRLTLQALAAQPVHLLWDEQNWCTDVRRHRPGDTSPEAATTAVGRAEPRAPVHVDNPWTNRLLLEGRFSTLNQKWGIWPHFKETNYDTIPRVAESGIGAGLTGSITSGAQTSWDADTTNTNMHLSTSYITGSHQLKAGWQSTLMDEWTSMDVNKLRLHYSYTGTAASGVPVPTQFTMYARPRTTDERSRFNAFYIQDQWTVGNRVTVNGALRYDHAWSYFPEQSTGPDRFIPIGLRFREDRRRQLRRHQPALERGVGRVRHRQDRAEVPHGPLPAAGAGRRHLQRHQPDAPQPGLDQPRLDRRQQQPRRRMRLQ